MLPLLLLILPQASFGQVTPGCALNLAGPPRSSLFDHTNAVFGGPPVPFKSGGTCITYDAVNAAFTSVANKLRLPRVNGEFELIDIGNLGTVLHEVSRQLAKQYSLSKEAVGVALPQLDTANTVIANYCPEFLMTPRCEVQRYRTVEGHCNNLENPNWAMAMNGHRRFLPADYADGISAPRVSVTGRPLPSARAVSAHIHKDEGFFDHSATFLMVAWGQFTDHDIVLTAETRDKRTKKSPRCCDGVQAHPNCLPIELPEQDHFFKMHNRKCMNFVRNEAGLRTHCRLGPREQFNTITSVQDAGTIYSNDPEQMENLRMYKRGLLKTLPVFAEHGMKDLLPLKLEDPDEGCIRPSEDVYCFDAGDPRVNEQAILGLLHTLFVREHNRIAEELSVINPHWDDETLYQESRKIIGAFMQHFTYNEFLPMVLGREVMQQRGLVLLKDGYFDGYDPLQDPTAGNGFSIAFRFGHTLLPTMVERWTKDHRYMGSQKLHELLQQPYDLYKAGWADSYLMGIINQVAHAFDDSITQEVTNHLFQEPGKKFGMDLIALNLQRGREHGIPSYNRWREWCGLKPMNTWDDLLSVMANHSAMGYAELYESPEDMDLWTAAVTERPLPGSMVGPTLACIIGKQFHDFRFGDRFWYENGGWPSSFTQEQLASIRKMKLSRVLCDSSDSMETIQVYAMVLPDHEINPRVSCHTGALPRLDLTLWRDAAFHSSPAQALGK